MADYTDLKAHLQRYADGCDPETVLEAVAAIATLEAENAKMRAAIIDRLHSEECDCNACADLRAALADQPTKG